MMFAVKKIIEIINYSNTSPQASVEYFDPSKNIP